MSSNQPEAVTASALIREAAKNHPNNVAYTFQNRHTTFAEFDHEVTHWAKALMNLGVERGEAVSILAGNHPHFLRLAFAAARIGAHLAPLNTWHKADELQYTLQHSDAVVLFTVDALRAHNFNTVFAGFLPELNDLAPRPEFKAAPILRNVVSLGEGLPGMQSLEAFLEGAKNITDSQLAARELQNTSSDLMYLLYTSGSTSKPKSVMIHQGNLLENGFHMGERQGIDERDRSWLATPLFYGVGALQALFSTWTHYARLVLQEAFDPAEAITLLDQQRCTVYYGFGNLTRKLLSHPSFDKSKVHLRKGMIGFSEEDRRLAIEDLGVVHGVSVFGMTELYGLAALTDYRDPLDVVMTTQGKPLPGVEIRILDVDSGDPVGPNIVGELVIKGRTTSGYYKDDARTAEAFTKDGYFRTGDLASLDENGRLVYQGRQGDMIKTGGVNVSPQEVEKLLDTVPGIKQAHVCAVKDEEQGEAIAAFIETDADVTPETIRTFLKARAASYKVPKYFFYKSDESLPRLASGKISLPALKQEAADLAKEKAGAK
ncbi:class I adenylate-forming enzyme family protein [Arthrobacter sp. Y81]|uniref:class I adenylate-forming enzyme family protein n=1 Tax=Arthrobacter sp. Y81 TaxID=2058897 RepID=UPI000CE34B63|nr:class I adenylate-forming enzyme family protein [Arthrobacter sp. Y81]